MRAHEFTHFDPALIHNVDDEHYLIGVMPPSMFLRLASPIAARTPSSHRIGAISDVLDKGDKLSTYPYLEIEIDGTEGFVTIHDGRHRAMELARRGISNIPVLLYFDGKQASQFDSVTTLYPQAHDDDEHYPGYDEDDLNEKARPIDPKVIRTFPPSKFV